MLEGQNAVLSSGRVLGAEAVKLLQSLRNSAMYRADQNSYTLYPDRQLKGFLEKARIPAELAASPSLQYALERRLTSVVQRDVTGSLHFAPALSNAFDLRTELDRLLPAHPDLATHQEELLVIYESTFHHHAFTGRSGTFFGFEGLGCIYWHMVAKVMLAAQEVALSASGEDFEQLRKQYYELRAGVGGFNKTPSTYGAFPADPYSHTPSHIGAQQPGMTGQVKEEILTRFGELGLEVVDGVVGFRPRLLRASEFLKSLAKFDYIDVKGAAQTVDLKAGQLAFTYCNTLVVYELGSSQQVVVQGPSGVVTFPGSSLDAEWSKKVFLRTGEVTRILVTLLSTQTF
eukprot:NODE_582_length_1586_cov_958.108653_g478_i0.p1 GENE.NODE_582_length_1586_cov_958.108653_g478_i0~~NODE_582_length_1586_cov_958.108653_g478_i0.p1  ORF type:complete len:344 (-),score=95.10 NODE_582_length_1586_cov_958.108653_g478_i0:256-1287(-)